MCILSFDVHVCSAEHSDLPLVQRFMNALWFGYVDHIIFDVNKKAIHFAHLLQVQLECAVNGAPSQIPTLDANVANSIIDGQTDGLTDLLSHTHTMWGGHVASFVKFRPVV